MSDENMQVKKLYMKDFGVFRNFTWPRGNSLPEFNDKNIIYGWNYSGKTTLSRIFTSLRDQQLHAGHKSAEVSIMLNDGREVTNTNIDECKIPVAVFNKEYVAATLHWDDANLLSEPIAFDIGENIQTRNEIERIDKKLKKVSKIKSRYGHRITDFTAYEESHFTSACRNFSLIVTGAPQQFNKRDLRRIRDEMAGNFTEYIVADDAEIERLKSRATAQDMYDPQDQVSFIPKFSDLFLRVKELLQEEPAAESVIDILEANKELYDWVHRGLDFDENKNSCAFCGNTITKERLTELNAYFSNASKKLRDRIQSLREEIESERRAIASFNTPTNRGVFIRDVHEEICACLDTLDTVRSNYDQTLVALLKELSRKEKDNIFNRLDIRSIESKEDAVNDWVRRINEAIKKHNSFIKDFDTQRDAARKKLERHLVADYLKSESYYDKGKRCEMTKARFGKLDALTEKLEKERQEKVNSLKTITKGKEELNSYIHRFLGRDDIGIEVTDDDKFLLQRGGNHAANLSEGEKTAIAFSYFLVLLESEGIDELQKTIIYIDDPVSSLDSNHIAQIYSLLNSFFFRKGINRSNRDQVVNCFSQLFISTHNFEFFSFLRDSSYLKRRKKVPNTRTGEKDEVQTCEFYLVQRVGKQQATLKKLPATLRRYKSEYINLFDLIHKYKDKLDTGEDYDSLILIPNAIRRFLEIYTLMRRPHEPDSVDARLRALLGGTHHFKALHHFSHFTTFEKFAKHDELLMIMPEACRELFELLERDTEHYESLCTAIGKR